MNSKCQSCGQPLKANTKFCTHCGARIETQKSTSDNPDAVFSSTKASGSGLSIVFIVIAALLVIGAGYWYVTKSGAATSALPEIDNSTDISGTYYDRTGAILGSPDILIFVTKERNGYSGISDDGRMEIKFTPMGSDNYTAELVLDRVPGDFEVHYYEEAGKLTFFNSLSKSSWYLLRKDQN